MEVAKSVGMAHSIIVVRYFTSPLVMRASSKRLPRLLAQATSAEMTPGVEHACYYFCSSEIGQGDSTYEPDSMDISIKNKEVTLPRVKAPCSENGLLGKEG